MTKAAAGKVWLIGAGPGDPGLITLKGARAIAGADVIVADDLAGPGVLLMARAGAEIIEAGKRAGRESADQDDICALLASKALEGLKVARVKGGDPYIFGRGGEEADHLEALGIPCEVVPGVSSATAAASCAGICLTDRRHSASVHVYTARNARGETPDLKRAANLEGTLVFMMSGALTGALASGLMAGGMSPATPCAVVSSASTPDQRTVFAGLSDVAEKAASAAQPSVLIVGEACSPGRIHPRWAGPLDGFVCAVTREGEAGDRMARALEEEGAGVLRLACTVSTPLADGVAGALEGMGPDDWMVFNSPASVRHFFACLAALRHDVRLLPRHAAAQGPGTAAALERMGVYAQAVSTGEGEEAFDRELDRIIPEGSRVLMPRSSLAPAGDFKETSSRGRDVRRPVAYTNTQASRSAGVRDRDLLRVDFAVFASASAVRAFARLYAPALGAVAVCAGSKTAAAASEAGMKAVRAAGPSDAEMMEALRSLAADAGRPG